MHAFLTAPRLAVTQFCSKQPYPSRREAMKVLKQHGPSRGLAEAGTGKLGAYRCNVCGQYHLGHK